MGLDRLNNKGNTMLGGQKMFLDLGGADRVHELMKIYVDSQKTALKKYLSNGEKP